MYSLPQSYNQTSKCKRCISSNAYAVILIVIATIIKNNKEVIEEDLKNNSILPLEYHYFYYAHSEGPKWLAIKDDISVLGTAHYKSKYPEAGVKAVVVSYAIEVN